MSVKCAECGASVQDDSKFCRYCGAKLPEEAKMDTKNRNFRFETINHAKIRREELKAEKAEAIEKARIERLEKEKELEIERRKSARNSFIILGVVFFILLIMLMLNR